MQTEEQLPESTADEPEAKEPVSKTSVLVVAAIFLVVAGGAYMFGRALRFTQPHPLTADVNRTLVAAPPTAVVPPDLNAATNSNAPTPDVNAAAAQDDAVWHTSDLKNFNLRTTTFASGLITWQVPTPKRGLGIFAYDPANAGQADSTEPATFLIGTFAKGAYAGKNLYLADVNCEGPCDSQTHFVLDGTTIVVLTKYSDDASDTSDIATAIKRAGKYQLVRDDQTDIPELDFPKTITLTNPKASLEHGANGFFSFNGFFSYDASLAPAFTDPAFGPAVPVKNGGLVFQAADGTSQYYRLVPNFITADDPIAKVTWSDGTKNVGAYSPQLAGGCGFQNYADIFDYPDADLTIAGHTGVGDPVYVFKNKDDQRYHDFYDNSYYAPPETKVTFQKFVSSRPMFFWKDPFGRLTRFINTDFQPQAECGKPVIYLYPTQREAVNVRVEPTGGMTKSDPAYEGGWKVIADPNGQLTETASGNRYPYLFWEGRSNGLWSMPTSGWNVAQSNVSSFLDATLAKLGLNTKESADFKSFWLPRFTGHPYYFVTFSGNSLMDKVAPLTVTPKPDTVIRILMDFKGEDAPIDAPEPHWNRPARNGFTVIEWGGVIR